MADITEQPAATQRERARTIRRRSAAQWDRRLARIKAIAKAVHARRQLAAGDQ
jgi:hypothetical protein